MSNKKIEGLNKLLSEIEKNIPFKDKKSDLVSKSNIGWQLDHALKVFNKVSESIESSNPNTYKSNFNIWRSVLFPLCYIPRGKAKSPRVVLPPNIILTEDLFSQLQVAKIHIDNIKTLPKTACFKHHVFGMLPKNKTLHFLKMHTKHHLKIVADILKT